MKLAASDIFPVINTWPLRLGRNLRQSFDASGNRLWTDSLTCALLTAALLFPLYSAPGPGAKHAGRLEIISLYVYQQTGILRSPQKCRSKLQHLYTCEEIKSALENYQPAPDASKRDELLVHLLPLVPLLRSGQLKQRPTPSPRQERPHSGPKAEFIKTFPGAASASLSSLGCAARPDPAAITSGAVAPLKPSDLVPRAPVLKAQVVLPQNLNAELLGGIQIELVVPGASSVECHTCSTIMSLLNRLNPVSSLGSVHIAPKGTIVSGILATRSEIVRDEIKWRELLSHFRNAQIKHEKPGSVSGFSVNGETGGQSGSSCEKPNDERSKDRSNGEPGVRDGVPSRPLPRRKASTTGAGVLSPLNPKSQTGTGVLAWLSGEGSKLAMTTGSRPMSPPLTKKQRRALGLCK
ncbi:hypothetical protein FRC04_000335 [Tulasnella sp. 424]|nr:hypothetical protein FRC04_000335 [Tulasnella sp. 424]KAG8982195.1 hypothetical protein FRC05_000337 [Tulasnella sp. 425]